MSTDPKDAERSSVEQPQGLSLYEWVLLFGCALFFIGYGINVLVTRQASAGRGFGPGLVTLGPISAWYVGLSLIVGGLIFPFAYVTIKRRRQKEQSVKDTQTIECFTAQGLSREAAETRLANNHVETQNAIRKEGIRSILIGTGLMVTGLLWVIVAISMLHNIIWILLGVAIMAMGKFQFFWPGIGRLITGRRRHDEVQ